MRHSQHKWESHWCPLVWKGLYSDSKDFVTLVNNRNSHCPQMGKTWNIAEPSPDWLAYQTCSVSAMHTHPGGQKKNSRTTSKYSYVSLASIRFNVHYSTTRKKWGKSGFHGRVTRPKPCWNKEHKDSSHTYQDAS